MICDGCGQTFDFLYSIDCYADKEEEAVRVVKICWKCVDKLDPDMWFVEQHWNLTEPFIMFHQLPMKEAQSG